MHDSSPLVNGGFAWAALLLGAIGVIGITSGWRMNVDEKQALVEAQQAIGFPVGHASAQQVWHGLRSRPTWRVLCYSTEEPPDDVVWCSSTPSTVVWSSRWSRTTPSSGRASTHRNERLMFDGKFRAPVDAAVKPLGAALRKTKLTPDHLTVVGLLVGAAAAVAVGSGRLRLGLILVIVAALPDLLDGALAKASNTSSQRGAFFDSTVDRVTDALLFGGIAYYFAETEDPRLVRAPVRGVGRFVGDLLSAAPRPSRSGSMPRAA